MKLFSFHIVLAAVYIAESDGLSVINAVPNTTTAIVVPPDSSSVTLSWNYTLNSGEQLLLITVGRTRGAENQDLVSYLSSNPSSNGVKEPFKSRMNFSVSGDEFHLVINNLVVNDGNGFGYKCQVITATGSSKSALVLLVVRVAAHNIIVVCDDAVLGQAMTCNCTADGDPAPTRFQWRASNGSVLGNGNSYTTPSIERTLNGSYYTCVVSNGFGPNATKNTPVFYVKEKPSNVTIFNQQANQSLTVNEGDDITLTCLASGGVPAVYYYKWQHNGNDINGAESGTLTLINVQRNQSGNYSCEGCNTHGCTRSNSVILIIWYKPDTVRISPHPLVTVNETDQTTLECQASGGYPSLYQYRWKYEGNDIDGEQNATLHLDNVQRNQSGNYSCQGCNMIGCASNTTIVIVQYKPDSIQLSPYPSVTLNETDNSTLQCQASGGNPDEYLYKWKHNGIDISGEVNNTLHLMNVLRNQSGKYSCLGCNGIGCTSNTTAVIVQYGPTQVQIGYLEMGFVNASKHYVNETKNATLHCRAVDGVPSTFFYKWQHNGKEVLGGEDGTLELTNVNRSQGGNYSCLAFNIMGNAIGYMQLIVQYKPDGVKMDGYIAVNETGTATLQCQGFGGNPAQYWYKWQHNGNDIGGENGTVELTFVNRSQSGNYTCSAHNILGSVTGLTTLDVHYPPSEANFMQQNVTVNETGNAILKCQASGGNPAIYWYKWQHNGDDISGGVNGTLQLVNVDKDQQGKYKCSAYNKAGFAEVATFVIVQYKPIGVQISPHPIITVNISDNATLHCQASGGNPADYLYKWKHNEKDISKGENGTLQLINIQSDEGGNYSCFVCNIVGCSDNSTNIIVQQKPTSVQISPHPFVTINEKGHTTLTCQASGGHPTLYQYKWKYKGNYIDGEQNTNLHLDNVQRNQSGNYSCQGCNTFGCTSNTTNVTVQYKPEQVNISATHLLVNESELINVTCQGYGGFPANYSYTWRLNGKDLHGGSDGELLLIATRNHSGILVCIVSNDAGYANATATVIVQYQPFNVSIVADPDSTVAVGKSLTLICTFDSGNLPASVEWKFNDTSMQQETNRTLVIQKVNVSDSGTYKCTAINILGNTTGEIVITVTPEKCGKNSCSGNGECTIQSDGVKKCKCKEGWHGENCNTCTCKPEGTVNGGCDVIDGQRICQCKDKYSGDLCELRSDEYDIVTGRFALTNYPYEEWMKDIKSNQAKEFIAMVRPLLQSGTSAKGCKITRLTKGSVEIHFELFFEKGKKEEKKEAVKKFIEGGKLGNYTIKEGSLVFQGTGEAVKSGLSTEAIIIIVLVVVALVIAIIALIMWRVQKDRCKRKRKVANGEEHKLCERNLSNPNVGYSNSGLEHAPYVEDGPTVTARQNERTKNGNNPNDLYAQVDMSKKTNKKKMPAETKKKKPGEVLYADLADFQPNVETEGSKAQQPVKKPEKYQSTDYASITDIIKEREGKSIKVPIAASHIPKNGTTGTTKVVNGVGDGAVVAAEPGKDGESVKDPVAVPDPNIPNNGSTDATKVMNGVGDGAVVVPELEKATDSGTETVGDSSNLLNRKDDVEEGKAEDILPQVA